MTQMCVDTTARQAAHLGFGVTVLRRLRGHGGEGAGRRGDRGGPGARTHLGSLQGFWLTSSR
jgi:hypothetical protein